MSEIKKHNTSNNIQKLKADRKFRILLTPFNIVVWNGSRHPGVFITERRVFNTEVWKHEEYEKRRAEHNAEYDTKHTKPEGMTKKQWQKEKSRKRKLQREEEKEQKLNRDFEFHNSPQRMFYKMIDSVDCECEAEKMRVGIFCETCVLISRVRQYMLDLFKDAAEGRSSYI